MRSKRFWNAGAPVVSPRAATKSALAGFINAPTADPTATAACCHAFSGTLAPLNLSKSFLPGSPSSKPPFSLLLLSLLPAWVCCNLYCSSKGWEDNNPDETIGLTAACTSPRNAAWFICKQWNGATTVRETTKNAGLQKCTGHLLPPPRPSFLFKLSRTWRREQRRVLEKPKTRNPIGLGFSLPLPHSSFLLALRSIGPSFALPPSPTVILSRNLYWVASKEEIGMSRKRSGSWKNRNYATLKV